MSFLVYDLTFLVIFVILMSIFLRRNRKNLKREGLLYLYRTSWGIRWINYVGKKYPRLLKIMSYLAIILGYLLMIGAIYLVVRIVSIYVFNPLIVREIKVPPIIPLVPYLPQIFNLSWLPSFNFTYWIVILAIIAISHEFAHGIVAVYNKVKIKTTGFGFFPFFLPVFLAAFVELDEKKMAKKSKFAQLSVLAAGTFANVLTAIFFLGVMWIFFSLAFIPTGVIFSNYQVAVIPSNGISSVNGIPVDGNNFSAVISLINGTELNKIMVGNLTFLTTRGILEKQINNSGFIGVYEDSPATEAGLFGAITELDGVKVTNIEQLSEEFLKYSPGDNITITTRTTSETLEYRITLGKNPQNQSEPWLGIAFSQTESGNVLGRIISALASFKDPYTFYQPRLGDASLFIYNLLWWLILISISVALVNMLPAGIFDGGRFFYLTLWGITGSEVFAKKAFSFVTYLFLFIIALVMFFWVLAIF